MSASPGDSSSSIAAPAPAPLAPPSEQCFSSHHSFRHSRTTDCVRIRITDTSSFLPKPCVPATIPSPLTQDQISAERWQRLAHDANAEIREWRKHASRIQWTARLLVLAGLVLGITSIPLFLRRRPDDADASKRRILAAIVLSALSMVCILLSVAVICRGASLERSARSDLIAILDWFSDETEDEPNHLSFELVKCLEQGGDDEDQTQGEVQSARRSSWVPIYHYFIKIVVRGGCEDGDGASAFSGDEFASDDAASDREETEAYEAIGAGDSLAEPLLTSSERNGMV